MNIKPNLSFIARFWACNLILISTFFGCFSTRTPADPSSESNWLPPTEYEILIKNFKTAIEKVDLGSYIRCFEPDQFLFLPDPQAITVAAGLFSNWTISQETVFFTNIFAKKGNISSNLLTLDNPRTVFWPDSLEYTSKYTLRLALKDTLINIEGIMLLKLIRKSNNWSIKRWQDSKTGSTPCFTNLKERYAR